MKIRKKKEKIGLDKEIEYVLERLNETNPLTDEKEYRTLCETLSRLVEIKAKTKRGFSLSPDTVATILAHLLGIGLILGFEQAHVITTKAFGLLTKLKL